jgi:hypothetical protein
MAKRGDVKRYSDAERLIQQIRGLRAMESRRIEQERQYVEEYDKRHARKQKASISNEGGFGNKRRLMKVFKSRKITPIDTDALDALRDVRRRELVALAHKRYANEVARARRLLRHKRKRRTYIVPDVVIPAKKTWREIERPARWTNTRHRKWVKVIYFSNNR